MATPPSTLESRIQNLLPELERVYTDIHAHPSSRCRSRGLRVSRQIGCAVRDTT